MVKYKLIIVLSWIVLPGLLIAQGYSVSPTIPDFTDLNASCVEATYGLTNNPFANKGVQAGRHTTVTHQGTDPRTGGKLKLLPEGESKVIKLGNENIHNEAESITYHFIVDKEKSILFLKFAVVFEDPSHTMEAQPRFVVRIMDAAGNLIESCAEYDVSARAEIKGFQTYNSIGAPIRWRDWTNVGLDMSRLAGQEVQVQFITYDCEYSGHYGYAYFTASCISNKLSLESCTDDEITISAPAGFSSYRWQDNTASPSYSLRTEGKDHTLSCEISSVTGCQFTLSAYIAAETTPPAESHVYYDTICEGEVYVDYDFELPPQYVPGTFTYYNSYFDVNNCKGDITTTLFLTVLKRYHPVTASICQGEDYTGHNFSIIQPAPGTHHDTIYYSNANGCDSIVPLTLNVSADFTLSQHLKGNNEVCTGTTETYLLPDADEKGTYAWETPQGFRILSEQGKNKITVQFTDIASSGSIILRASNGCGHGDIEYPVTVHRSYSEILSDSTCTGEEYHKYNFHLPANDSAGYYAYFQSNRSVSGCDSTISLRITTFPVPSVKISVSDSVVCKGDAVQLHARTSSDTLSLLHSVAVGDLLCSDNTTIKPTEYGSSGKNVIGVVFWVDHSGKHGWAIHPQIQAYTLTWKRSIAVPDPPLAIYSTERLAMNDTSGYLNTKIVWDLPIRRNYPLLDHVDFTNGWYIPAISQLNIIYGATNQLNASLQIIGGKLLSGSDEFWSSTLGSEDNFWCSLGEGIFQMESFYYSLNLRVVRTF